MFGVRWLGQHACKTSLFPPNFESKQKRMVTYGWFQNALFTLTWWLLICLFACFFIRVMCCTSFTTILNRNNIYYTIYNISLLQARMGGGVERMISLQFMALLLSVNFVAAVAEEREIYLVLMEGHPVAFHTGYPPSEDERRVKPKRFGLKTCCKTK